jgi:transposase
MMVARVWKRERPQPHRLESYMVSNDPDFEKNAADVIGLYANPPQHAVVFSIDEKTAIQALDRREPVLPLSPGRDERHGFEYYRHGTLSLYAALNTRSGEVLGKTAPRHTSAEFVAFLSDVVASQPRTRDIHLIADNLSTHETKKVREFLASHPRVHIRYTPTYSSWLNQVETLVLQNRTRRHRNGYLQSSPTFGENSCGISATTTLSPNPSNGPTAIPRNELLVPNQLLRSTSLMNAADRAD